MNMMMVTSAVGAGGGNGMYGQHSYHIFAFLFVGLGNLGALGLSNPIDSHFSSPAGGL